MGESLNDPELNAMARAVIRSHGWTALPGAGDFADMEAARAALDAYRAEHPPTDFDGSTNWARGFAFANVGRVQVGWLAPGGAQVVPLVAYQGKCAEWGWLPVYIDGPDAGPEPADTFYESGEAFIAHLQEVADAGPEQ